MRSNTNAYIAAVLTAVLLLTPLTALATPDDRPSIVPPDPYKDLTARWWRWAWSIPAKNNPILVQDANKFDCTIGQSGPVWFLSGTAGFTANRVCNVPAGKAILFPIVNVGWDDSCPGTVYPAPGPLLEQFLVKGAQTFFDNSIVELEADVDGVRIEDLNEYRVTSTMFDFVGDKSLASWDNCITGKKQHAVSDGYWIMLNPVSAGRHSIHFIGKQTFPDGSSFRVEVTYHLSVAESHHGDH